MSKRTMKAHELTQALDRLREKNPVQRIVIEGTMPVNERSSHKNDWTGYDSDDGGMYLTARIADDRSPIYVDIKSSTEDDLAAKDEHRTFHALCGKRVRITIEALD